MRAPLVVELELPAVMRISTVVDVSRLKRFRRVDSDRFPGREQTDRPPPMDVDGNLEYELEHIMGKRRVMARDIPCHTIPGQVGRIPC